MGRVLTKVNCNFPKVIAFYNQVSFMVNMTRFKLISYLLYKIYIIYYIILCNYYTSIILQSHLICCKISDRSRMSFGAKCPKNANFALQNIRVTNWSLKNGHFVLDNDSRAHIIKIRPSSVCGIDYICGIDYP